MPEISGEISTSVECSLGHNSRKRKELGVPLLLPGALDVPLCFSNSRNHLRHWSQGGRVRASTDHSLEETNFKTIIHPHAQKLTLAFFSLDL